MNIAKNQFDPQMMVVIVDVTKNVPPDTLHYNLRDKDRTLVTAEPSFDEFGDPIYTVPRFYAERQLQNCGGRTFKLVSPNTLVIKMPNGRGGTSYKTLNACTKRPNGEWLELSDKEIAEIELSYAEEDSESEVKPQRVPGVSKRATRKVAKTVEITDQTETDAKEQSSNENAGE